MNLEEQIKQKHHLMEMLGAEQQTHKENLNLIQQ